MSDAAEVDGTDLGAKRRLQDQLERGLAEGATAGELVELVIGAGWQPRPVPDPNSDYLEGVLADGTRVPVEIRHAAAHRVA